MLATTSSSLSGQLNSDQLNSGQLTTMASEDSLASQTLASMNSSQNGPKSPLPQQHQDALLQHDTSGVLNSGGEEQAEEEESSMALPSNLASDVANDLEAELRRNELSANNNNNDSENNDLEAKLAS